MGARQSIESRREDQAGAGGDPSAFQPGDGGAPLVPGFVRLNLGCGRKRLVGFINIDLPGNWSGKTPDVEADVTKALPFPESYADEVHAYHLLEHIWRWKAENVLREWLRVLKPGGKLVLELPCLDKIISAFKYFQDTGEPINEQLTLWGLYGDPGYQHHAMAHKWCWSVGEITETLEKMGLEVAIKEPETHVPIRDMRIEAVKCR